MVSRRLRPAERKLGREPHAMEPRTPGEKKQSKGKKEFAIPTRCSERSSWGDGGIGSARHCGVEKADFFGVFGDQKKKKKRDSSFLSSVDPPAKKSNLTTRRGSSALGLGLVPTTTLVSSANRSESPPPSTIVGQLPMVDAH